MTTLNLIDMNPLLKHTLDELNKPNAHTIHNRHGVYVTTRTSER